jgi:hyperosmotically inducible protein
LQKSILEIATVATANCARNGDAVPVSTCRTSGWAWHRITSIRFPQQPRKGNQMNRFTISSLPAIVVVAALSLAACDQKSNSALTKPADAPPASTAATTATEKVAAATDKVATVVDDTALTAKVKAALMAEPGLSSLQIGVDTKNATVTLTGAVDNTTSRDKAKQVASSVAGVTNVVDQLTVKS